MVIIHEICRMAMPNGWPQHSRNGAKHADFSVQHSLKSRPRSNGGWEWAGCIMADKCVKFY